MRFRADVKNISTFTKFTGSLATLGHIAWLRLDDKDLRFTVIPENGSQLWSVLAIDTLFETYTIQSQATNNAINIEVPLAPLQRALKSAHNAIAANIRLTKKDNIPLLSLTITTTTSINYHAEALASQAPQEDPAPHETRSISLRNDNAARHVNDGADFSFGDSFGSESFANGNLDAPPATNGESVDFGGRQDREMTVTQDVPIRVLAPTSVEALHEPRCRDPDCHIVLPNLLQLKNISDRFTKLALTTRLATRSGFASIHGPKLELSANMHGCLRLALNTDSMRINSLWTGLENPELDPTYIPDGEDGVANHPSTRMREVGDSQGVSEQGWASVRIDGRDWGRVLSVGRLGGRVIACFCHDHALILYVFMNHDDPQLRDNVLTVSLAILDSSLRLTS